MLLTIDRYVSPTVEELFGPNQPNRTIMTLPLMESDDTKLRDTGDSLIPEDQKHQSVNKNDALDDGFGIRLIEAIKGYPEISQITLAETLGVSRRSIQRKMNDLVLSGQLKRIGGKRYGHWEIAASV